MFRSISKRLPCFLVLSLALGLPIPLLAQSGTDLSPLGTDETSDASGTQFGTDFAASDPIPWPDREKEPPSPSSVTFVLWALSLAGLALAITTGIFLQRFVKAIDAEKKLSAESHWGGFGGGLGGWQISASLAYLLIALVFGSLFTLLVLKMADVVAPKKDEKPAATDEASTDGAETTEEKGSEGTP